MKETQNVPHSLSRFRFLYFQGYISNYNIELLQSFIILLKALDPM